MPLMNGEKAAVHEEIFAEESMFPNNLMRCIRTERYKFIRNFCTGLQSNAAACARGRTVEGTERFYFVNRPEYELHDLTSDPHELHNCDSGQAQRKNMENPDFQRDHFYQNIEDLTMTPREHFTAALDRKDLPGRVPTFELVFFLTMEAFGKVHPLNRSYYQWDQMEEKERQLHRKDIAETYIMTAEKYEHSAIFIHPNPGDFDETVKIIALIREMSGDKYFLMLPGDATYEIPGGDKMLEFSYRLVDEPEKVKTEAESKVNSALERAARFRAANVSPDGFALCSDYCLNTGPFLSPGQFSDFVAPYLAKLIKGYRDMGYYTIKHTDGNIMPILGQIVQCHPHALHSLDPQGGVDIAEVKRLVGKEVCLIGNVNCGLMDTGSIEEIRESARYAIANGKPGGGYIFSTSNSVYTGMKLESYEAILDVWRREG